MAKHCADEHCGNFAAKNSEWCRKHHQPRRIMGVCRHPSCDTPVLAGINWCDAHKAEHAAHETEHHDSNPALAISSVTTWSGKPISATCHHDDGFEHPSDGHLPCTLTRADFTPEVTLTIGRHRAAQPRRRRSWRHPIRGMIVR